MRGRVIGAVLGAAVLAAAVVALRDQAPPTPATADTPVPTGVDTRDGGLPARDVSLPWVTVVPPTPAFDVISGETHVAYVRTTAGMTSYTVTANGSDGATDLGSGGSGGSGVVTVAQHAIEATTPWSAVMRGGRLVIAHGRRPHVLLTTVDAATGAVATIEPPAGHAFGPQVAPLGDEVLVLGRRVREEAAPTVPSTGAEPPRLPGLLPWDCVLAARPDRGTSRVVWCGDTDLTTWLTPSGTSVAWPATPAAECARWLWLRAGDAEPHDVPAPDALCGARDLVEVGGWQAAVVASDALVAATADARVRIGRANAVVPCGERLYWTVQGDGGRPSIVYRWRPGDDHREVALRVEPTFGSGVGDPRCVGDDVHVGVRSADDGVRLVEVRALTRP